VLAGIDDGPPTREGSLALARAASAAGIETILATPHVSRRYDNHAAQISGLVADLNECLAAERVDVEVLPGAEVSLMRAAGIDQQELERLHLGGGPWLLVEPPTAPGAHDIEERVAMLQAQGHRVLLAHPERCAPFHQDPQLLAALVRAGALVSITAGSLIGRFGAPPRRFALELVREGLVHNVVSDAHDVVGRPPEMRGALERAQLEPLSDWLTREVPAAILAGGEIPRRPSFVAPPAPRAGLPWRPRRSRLRKTLGRS